MRCFSRLTLAAAAAATLAVGVSVQAEVKLPAILGSNMVLQRGMEVPIWGWADPGEQVQVEFNGQSHEVLAGKDGRWKLKLKPMEAARGLELTIRSSAGGRAARLENVAVGEVWVCSGQSNMQMSVARSFDADLEQAAADYPDIRIVRVNTLGSQEPQTTFEGQWQSCSPQTIGAFSAVGYFFGRQLHQTLGVPVGLIDNSWGGSSCEAWVPRELLKDPELYGPLMQRWAKTEAEFDWEKVQAQFETKLAAWKVKAGKARANGAPAPPRPRPPRNVLVGQHRPGNLHNARLLTVAPMGIRGAIWYQGESNAGRAYQYRHLFPLMINHWRSLWGQGDFPFYFVQLADFRDEKAETAESDWAELREAQTMTLAKVPNTGQAVIIDLGEANDIHPRNKQDVAMRLARWALAKDYGLKIPCRSPELKSVEFQDGKAIVTLQYVEGQLKAFDVRQLRGFTIAGEDRAFRHATAKLLADNRIEVSHPEVKAPASVRYGWADNPICNLRTAAGLPVTPFRSDDWPGVTAESR